MVERKSTNLKFLLEDNEYNVLVNLGLVERLQDMWDSVCLDDNSPYRYVKKNEGRGNNTHTWYTDLDNILHPKKLDWLQAVYQQLIKGEH